MTQYDVVTLGETMLRLTPPDLQPVELATMLEIHAGGSESNTAVGLARLGAHVAWLSRLPDNPLGHLVTNRIREHGVDVSHIVWAKEERMGLYFVEDARKPRPARITYDRKNSAISLMQPDELPAGLFQAGKARLLHLTGITPALSKSAYETAKHVLAMAKAANWLVSFDINYRSKLWKAELAQQRCEVFMQAADVIFSPVRDVHTIYDFTQADETAETTLLKLHKTYPRATIVLTQGSSGSIACDSAGNVKQQPVIAAELVGRIGGGDAFTAGFLYSYLTHDQNIEKALRWGSAVAALKYTIPGDMPIINKADVLSLVQDDDHTLLLR